MAYATPKTNWAAADIPVASDFNRIEGNTEANHDDIAAEVIARAADVDAEKAERIASVQAEADARYVADALKQNLPSTVTNYSLADFPVGTTILVFSQINVPRTYALSPMTQSGSFLMMYTTTYEAGQVPLAGSWLARGGFRHYHQDLDIQGWMILAQRVA